MPHSHILYCNAEHRLGLDSRIHTQIRLSHGNDLEQYHMYYNELYLVSFVSASSNHNRDGRVSGKTNFVSPLHVVAGHAVLLQFTFVYSDVLAHGL